jgi:hypothetical protein
MPWQDGTLTVADVTTHLGVGFNEATGERLARATDTARAVAQRRRCNTDPLVLWSDPAAHDGGVRYAGLLYRSAAAPTGFASYEPQDASDYTEFARAMDHIGLDPVVA